MHQRAEFCVDRLDICGDMAVFLLSKMAVVRHLGFLQVRNVTYRSDGEGQYASPCQILYQSVELLQRYGRFLIFQDGGDLGFVLRVFGPPTNSICWSMSLCKIWLESVQ